MLVIIVMTITSEINVTPKGMSQGGEAGPEILMIPTMSLFNFLCMFVYVHVVK